MAQFHSIHLYYGCLRPTSPSNPQARAPSPGYTETKSAVPRKRIGENSTTRETYKQAHPATHRDSGVSRRQPPSDIASGARAHVGAQDARHARHKKWNAIIENKNAVNRLRKQIQGEKSQATCLYDCAQVTAHSGDTRHDAIPHFRKSEIARARYNSRARGSALNNYASPQTSQSTEQQSGKRNSRTIR